MYVACSWLNVQGENGIHSLWGQRDGWELGWGTTLPPHPIPPHPRSLPHSSLSTSIVIQMLRPGPICWIELYLFKSDYTWPEICPSLQPPYSFYLSIFLSFFFLVLSIQSFYLVRFGLLLLVVFILIRGQMMTLTIHPFFYQWWTVEYRINQYLCSVND